MLQSPPPRLMVVGATGRVGRLLIPGLRASGAGVVLTHRGAQSLDLEMPALHWAPLEGAAPLHRWTEARGVPSAMLVLAGSTPSTGTDMAQNVAIARACVAAARAAGIGRILLASSSAIYGTGRAEPWHEEDPVAPPSAYGQAKLAMERACAGPDVCALRIGNVAGADALLTNPARPLVLDRFEARHGPIRSYIGPQTLARVLLDLAGHEAVLPAVLNIGAPVPVDMAHLAREARLPVQDRPAPASAIGQLVLDTARLESLVHIDDTESSASSLVAQWRACQTP